MRQNGIKADTVRRLFGPLHLSVGIVFDTSSSMSGDKIVRARDALARFVETSHEEDEYFLIGFDSTANLLVEGARGGNAVLDRISRVSPGGDTALYDAVYLGIEKVSRGIYPKHAVILISDGEDNHSRYSFGKLRRRLQESGVAIYAISVQMNYLPRKGIESGGVIMERLASVSGGKIFYPKNADEMAEVFESIALELRRQYSIGYLPSNFVADGRWHRVKVAMRQQSSRLVVRSREGYYAIQKTDNHRE